MFELPETVNLASQMNETLQGKIVKEGRLGISPHKFLWYNRTHEEFEQLTRDKQVGKARAQGKWLFVPLDPGYVLVLGECGGKILYHLPGSKVPQKYHLYLTFTDGSFLTAMTRMWGAMELYAQGDEQEREYIKEMRPTPIEPAFTFDYFDGLLDNLLAARKQSAKGLLTQDQVIPGLGNAIAQDILFQARIHPKRSLSDLSDDDRRALFEAILGTVQAALEKGGRYDEVDLHGQPGGYVRLMDGKALSHPCPRCGGAIEKFQYLGGACYVCPTCQT